MLQSEFQNHTDIYPDVLLYEAAEHEYNNGEWDDKAQFCNAYKDNKDDLAEKIQRIANERWFKMEEQNAALRTENNRLEDENENLRTELHQLTERVDAMQKSVTPAAEFTMLETAKGLYSIQEIRAAMQMALTDAAHDDYSAELILHGVWAYEYLLQRLVAE